MPSGRFTPSEQNQLNTSQSYWPSELLDLRAIPLPIKNANQEPYIRSWFLCFLFLLLLLLIILWNFIPASLIVTTEWVQSSFVDCYRNTWPVNQSLFSLIILELFLKGYFGCLFCCCCCCCYCCCWCYCCCFYFEKESDWQASWLIFHSQRNWCIYRTLIDIHGTVSIPRWPLSDKIPIRRVCYWFIQVLLQYFIWKRWKRRRRREKGIFSINTRMAVSVFSFSNWCVAGVWPRDDRSCAASQLKSRFDNERRIKQSFWRLWRNNGMVFPLLYLFISFFLSLSFCFYFFFIVGFVRFPSDSVLGMIDHSVCDFVKVSFSFCYRFILVWATRVAFIIRSISIRNWSICFNQRVLIGWLQRICNIFAAIGCHRLPSVAIGCWPVVEVDPLALSDD